MNWNWLPFGRYTRFLERQLAESRADMLERLREKDEQIKSYRVQVGALEAKVMRLEMGVPYSRATGKYSGFVARPSPNDSPVPDFTPAEVGELDGEDWQSRTARIVAQMNIPEEAPHESTVST